VRIGWFSTERSQPAPQEIAAGSKRALKYLFCLTVIKLKMDFRLVRIFDTGETEAMGKAWTVERKKVFGELNCDVAGRLSSITEALVVPVVSPRRVL